MRGILPALPEAAPSNIGDVLEYARVVEQFANSQPRELTKVTTEELGVRLDMYAHTLCADKEIVVSGIYKVFEPIDGEIGGVITTLERGIKSGRSYGYSIFESDSLEPPPGDDEEQDEVYEELRARLGKYTVSQLVTHKSRIVSTPEQGIIVHERFQVVAPIETNDILIPDELNWDAEANRNEANAVLSTVNPVSKQKITEIKNALAMKDPIQGLLRASKSINAFLAHNPDVYRGALSDLIGAIVPMELFHAIYTVESLPPVYLEKKGDEDMAISTILLPVQQIAINQLMLLDRYFIKKDGEVVTPPGASPGLFLGATAAITPWGETIKFLIPAEHIEVEGDIIRSTAAQLN